MTKLVIVVLLLLIPLPLIAAGLDRLAYGNSLLSVCENAIVDDYRTLPKRDQADGLLCYGYISGFNDGHRMMAVWSALKHAESKNNLSSEIETEPRYCHPENTTKKQILSIVVQYLQEHREDQQQEQSLIHGLQSIVDINQCAAIAPEKPRSSDRALR